MEDWDHEACSATELSTQLNAIQTARSLTIPKKHRVAILPVNIQSFPTVERRCNKTLDLGGGDGGRSNLSNIYVVLQVISQAGWLCRCHALGPNSSPEQLNCSVAVPNIAEVVPATDTSNA
jgi:hypothetical protein